MKTLKQILENNEPFELSEKDVVKYNTMDHPDYMQGKTANGKAQVVYSVYAVNLKEDICFTQNINAWGRCIDEVQILSHLVKYEY